jgi:hypothetical protein
MTVLVKASRTLLDQTSIISQESTVAVSGSKGISIVTSHYLVMTSEDMDCDPVIC